jgi:hypothetical protein
MSSKLDSASDDAARAKVKQAEEDLYQLDSAYAEIAADAALMAGSMAPPPFGTAADVVSIGKSLWTRDWGGALLDVVGLIPVAGDAIKGVGKGTKIANKMKQVEKALKAARAALVRQRKALILGRKRAAMKYWADIRKKGKAAYGKAIKKCSTQSCPEELVTKKGPQYQYAPKSGRTGSWAEQRGDGYWIPTKGSDLDKALKKYNKTHKTKFDRVHYKDGFPDYDNFIYKTPDGTLAKVEIPQMGGEKDFAVADKAMRELLGNPKWKKPKGYTWHHEPDGVTMKLVPEDIHGFPETPHSGGTSLSTQPDF